MVCCCTAVTRSSNLRKAAVTWRFVTCCCMVSYRTKNNGCSLICWWRRHTMLHEGIRRFMHGYRLDAHPMGMMVGIVGALSTYYHDAMDITDPESRMISAIRMIAKMPSVAADAYKHTIAIRSCTRSILLVTSRISYR